MNNEWKYTVYLTCEQNVRMSVFSFAYQAHGSRSGRTSTSARRWSPEDPYATPTPQLWLTLWWTGLIRGENGLDEIMRQETLPLRGKSVRKDSTRETRSRNTDFNRPFVSLILAIYWPVKDNIAREKVCRQTRQQHKHICTLYSWVWMKLNLFINGFFLTAIPIFRSLQQPQKIF